MHQLSAGAEMNQTSKSGIVRACKMAMSVDKQEIERKAENILINMYGAYDAALLSPLTFSALVKDLADQASSKLLTTTRGQFHQHFTCRFFTLRSKKRKKDSQLKQLFVLLDFSVKNRHKS